MADRFCVRESRKPIWIWFKFVSFQNLPALPGSHFTLLPPDFENSFDHLLLDFLCPQCPPLPLYESLALSRSLSIPSFLPLFCSLLCEDWVHLNEDFRGLERWLSGEEPFLFSQRTQACFPTSVSNSSQPPMTPARRDLAPLACVVTILTYTYPASST